MEPCSTRVAKITTVGVAYRTPIINYPGIGLMLKEETGLFHRDFETYGTPVPQKERDFVDINLTFLEKGIADINSSRLNWKFIQSYIYKKLDIDKVVVKFPKIVIKGTVLETGGVNYSFSSVEEVISKAVELSQFPLLKNGKLVTIRYNAVNSRPYSVVFNDKVVSIEKLKRYGKVL